MFWAHRDADQCLRAVNRPRRAARHRSFNEVGVGVAVPGPMVGAGLPGLSSRAVAYSAGGEGGRRSPEFLTQFYTRDFWFRLSQCHRGVLISHSQYKLGGKAFRTIRKTRRCHTPTWRRVQHAVLLNGVGHHSDGHNAASSDASNRNFRTLMLPSRLVYFEAPANDGSARSLCLRAPPASHRV
jgi:hypothetical protein